MSKKPKHTETLRPLAGKVLVDEFDKGERKVGEIILRNDDGKSEGVRDRWAKVHAVADDITDIVAGDWILVKHGRWTKSIKVNEDLTVWGVEWPQGVMAVSELDGPAFDTFAEDQNVEDAWQKHR